MSEVKPQFLQKEGLLVPAEFASYTLIPLSAGKFPHLSMHWLPSVLLGVLGQIDFPGLVRPAANALLIKLIDFHAPSAPAGLLAVGVFEAVMSSLDSQTLAVSIMFTQNILRHYGFYGRMSERQQVLFGSIFVVVVFDLSLIVNRSIFGLGIWSFSGFAALFSILVAFVYRRRTTAVDVLARIGTAVITWIHFCGQGWADPTYTLAGRGFKPVVAMTGASSLVLVSMVTRASVPDRIAGYFDGPA